MEKKNSFFDTKKMVGIATFSALAFVATLMTSWITVAGFLSLDAKDAIITIAAFVYGPISAVIISVITALIEFFTISFSTTGWYGLIMNIASSATFSLVASLIYSKKRDINGAIIGFCSAVIATTGVMILLNIFVTPFYLVWKFGMLIEVARGEVMSMLPITLMPFNLMKSLMNSAIAMLLYKPTITALARARLIDAKGTKTGFNRNSVIITIAGVVCIVAAVAIYFIVLK